MQDNDWRCRTEVIGQSRFEIRDRENPSTPTRRNLQIEIDVDSPWYKGRLRFPACGDCDMRDWIATIGADYIADNAFGLRYEQPNLSATLKDLRRSINESRADGDITVEDANRFRAIVRDYADRRLAGDPEDALLAALVDVARRAPLYGGMGFSDYQPRGRVSPNAKAFIQHGWLRLANRLEAEFDREMMAQPETDEVSPMVEPEPSDNMDMSL